MFPNFSLLTIFTELGLRSGRRSAGRIFKTARRRSACAVSGKGLRLGRTGGKVSLGLRTGRGRS